MNRFHRVLEIALPAALLLVGCDTGIPETNDVEAESASSTAIPAKMGPSAEHELAEVQQATARYQDVGKAQADGYAQFSPHVPNMGFHYLTDSAINTDGSSALDNSLDRLNPEILVYVDDATKSSQRRLVAAEYAIPMTSNTPPTEAVNLFSGADASDWHVHPSRHELGLGSQWTIHGECHYEGGIGVFLAENPMGSFVLLTPVGSVGTWNGLPIETGDCPTMETDLLIVHGKWWTLHTWVWFPNPEGIFHATNPRVDG